MRVLWKILLSNGIISSQPMTVWSLSKEVIVVTPGVGVDADVALAFDFAWACNPKEVKQQQTAKGIIQSLGMEADWETVNKSTLGRAGL